jgi:hypothetical protein
VTVHLIAFPNLCCTSSASAERQLSALSPNKRQPKNISEPFQYLARFLHFFYRILSPPSRPAPYSAHRPRGNTGCKPGDAWRTAMPVCAQTVCALVMSPKAGPKNGQAPSGSILGANPSNGKNIGQGVWRANPHPLLKTSRTTRPVFPLNCSTARPGTGRGKDETRSKFAVIR